ncbi:DUF3810 domain-containing protein [Maribacter hydrothermalis]|uniref:Amino acid permease n=1 Tax=Maribacter hydrothermalis TaxID=1836467 RepID=A0A1B7ZDC6_9FLAO|nr:DUF3810 domain-containing protein [Maribacter hydrothermalis]APQ18435.1 amino acid permease [Maribacter hydrothermalis]OBR41358.1 amino acid permease [Maribacter hydrothermalis]
MKISFKNAVALALIPQIIIVKWLGNYTHLVEQYYSTGIYPFISKFFRVLFGWISFSVGDIIYFILILLSITYLIKKRKSIWKNKLQFTRNVFMILSVAYFTFHFMWGMNYYREPLAQKLNIKANRDYEELVDFTARLIDKTNETHLNITQDSSIAVNIPYTQKQIFEKTVLGYEQLQQTHPFLSYTKPSIKTSLFSTGLTYMGYAGYLNPFTNEAQVNGLLPNFRFPVVAGHEIGHQLGYSAENETNFIGYLVTSKNEDIYFQYAAYAYALGYCLNDIRSGNQEEFIRLLSSLNPGVKNNFQEMAVFWNSYENPMEPIFKSIFNSFLKANNQTEGIRSYNAVVGLLVAYHKKHPL